MFPKRREYVALQCPREKLGLKRKLGNVYVPEEKKDIEQKMFTIRKSKASNSQL